MIHITDAPTPKATSDIILLKESCGELNPGAAGFVAVDSFDIPALCYGDFYDQTIKVVVYMDIDRYVGAEAGGWNFQILASTSGTTPGSGIMAGANGYVRVEVYPSVFNDLAGVANVTYFQTTSTSTGSGADNSTWGDVLNPQTIYINMQRRASTAFLYKYQVYLIGVDLK